jgi:hypothetical protein
MSRPTFVGPAVPNVDETGSAKANTQRPNLSQYFAGETLANCRLGDLRQSVSWTQARPVSNNAFVDTNPPPGEYDVDALMMPSFYEDHGGAACTRDGFLQLGAAANGPMNNTVPIDSYNSPVDFFISTSPLYSMTEAAQIDVDHSQIGFQQQSSHHNPEQVDNLNWYTTQDAMLSNSGTSYIHLTNFWLTILWFQIMPFKPLVLMRTFLTPLARFCSRVKRKMIIPTR